MPVPHPVVFSVVEFAEKGNANVEKGNAKVGLVEFAFGEGTAKVVGK